MTIEEAIRALNALPDKTSMYIVDYEETGLKCTSYLKQACDLAITALRAQQEQPNEPLTLEELREMDGEPVWVQDLLIPKCSVWHFAIKHDGEIRLFDTVALGRGIVGYNATTGENYGKTWLAYRRKPEQEEYHDNL